MNNEKKVTHRPLGRSDYSRQRLEQGLAALISDWEAENGVAVYSIELTRTSCDRDGKAILKSYPLKEDPQGPLARVEVVFAKGPLVSTSRLIAEELEPPAEAIEEKALRLAKEADLASAVELAEEAGLEPVRTEKEAYRYGGRYA